MPTEKEINMDMINIFFIAFVYIRLYEKNGIMFHCKKGFFPEVLLQGGNFLIDIQI